MKIGYTRPLEADDLWTLTEDLQCQNVADRLEGHLQRRLPPSKRIDKFKPLNSTPVVTSRKPQGPSKSESTVNVNGGNGDSEKVVPNGSEVDLSIPAIDEGVITAVDDALAVLDPNVVGDGEKLRETEAVPAPVATKKLKLNPEYVKQFGKRKAKKIAAGTMAVEDGKTYDQSLLKAMFSTVWFEWCFSVLLNACAGESN